MKFHKRHPQRFSHVGDVLLSHAVVFSPCQSNSVSNTGTSFSCITYSFLYCWDTAVLTAMLAPLSSFSVSCNPNKYWNASGGNLKIFHECAVSLWSEEENHLVYLHNVSVVSSFMEAAVGLVWGQIKNKLIPPNDRLQALSQKVPGKLLQRSFRHHHYFAQSPE